MSGSFDAVITNGLVVMRGAAEATGRAVGGLATGMEKLGSTGSKEFAKIGQAITKMGGPMADIGGKFFGALGMEGGLARLAVAATLAGIAFKALTSNIQAAEARAQAFATAAAGLREVELSARGAREGFATGSESTGRLTAAAESVYGPGASQIAADYATTYKSNQEEVLRALVALRGIPINMGIKALRIALTAAQTQEVSPTAMVAKLTDRGTLERVLGARKRDGMTVEESQAAMLLALDRGRFGPGAMDDAAMTVRSSRTSPGPAQRRVPGVDSAHGITTRGQIKAFISGETENAVRKSAAAAVEPLSAALLAWKQKQDEGIKKLMDASASVGPVIESLKDFGMLLGGEGSRSNQAMRDQIATGEAVLGTGGN